MSWERPSSWYCTRSTTRRFIPTTSAPLRTGKFAKFGTVKEVMTKEVLSEIYRVEFEIMEIEGRPLSIYY